MGKMQNWLIRKKRKKNLLPFTRKSVPIIRKGIFSNRTKNTEKFYKVKHQIPLHMKISYTLMWYVSKLRYVSSQRYKLNIFKGRKTSCCNYTIFLYIHTINSTTGSALHVIPCNKWYSSLQTFVLYNFVLK